MPAASSGARSGLTGDGTDDDCLLEGKQFQQIRNLNSVIGSMFHNKHLFSVICPYRKDGNWVWIVQIKGTISFFDFYVICTLQTREVDNALFTIKKVFKIWRVNLRPFHLTRIMSCENFNWAKNKQIIFAKKLNRSRQFIVFWSCCGQYYKSCMIVLYDSSVLRDNKIAFCMPLKMKITIIEHL